MRQDGIHVQDGLHGLEDGFGGQAIAIIDQPLDVPDPDGNLGQLVSVLIDLYA